MGKAVRGVSLSARLVHKILDGRRCVLIITGKGGARDDFDGSFMPDRDSGVLRRNLPRWLGEAPMRPLVLRLESARPQHGGDGAYYVLLRRKR